MLSSRVPSSPSDKPLSMEDPRRSPGNLDGLDSGVGGSLSDRPTIWMEHCKISHLNNLGCYFSNEIL